MWPGAAPFLLAWLGTCILSGCRFGYETLAAAQRGAGDAAADGGEERAASDASADAYAQDAPDGEPDAATERAGDAGGIGYAPCASGDCSCAQFDGRSYRVCAGPLGFADAAAECERHGARLVRIDSAEENAKLHAVATAVLDADVLFAFIGASDAQSEGSWRWLDGAEFWVGDEAGSAVGGLYAQWDDKKPFGNATRNCAGMLATGAWEDRSCTSESAYLCEGP